MQCQHVLTYQMSTRSRTIQAQASKIMFFVVCSNVNVQDIQCFCLHLFSLTNISETKKITFYKN